MPKITAADLRQLAQDNGYKGDDKDLQAMRKCLEDSGATPQFEGKDLTWAEVDIESEAKRVISLPNRKTDQKPEEKSGDWDAKVKSLLEEELKRRNIEKPTGRPENVGAKAQPVEVKTSDERIYENKVRSGTAVLGDDYGIAKGIAHWWAYQGALACSKVKQAEEHFQKYAEIMERKGYAGATIAAGGALVPEQYEVALINLVKDFGVARRLCTVVNMTGDKVVRPKVTGALTVYYPDEGSAATESTQTWSLVSLQAKKGVVFTKMSDEIVADAAIDLVEHTTREQARAIATIEDESLFNGTGAGAGTTYIPNVRGIIDIFGGTATTDSRSQIGGDTSDVHTRAFVLQALGKVPSFVGGNIAWHCAHEMAAMLHNAAQTAGGVTTAEVAGRTVQMLYGYPIITNNVMNRNFNTSGDIVDVLVGDISQAAWFGNRQGVQIDISRERFFDTMQLAVRAVVRHDIVVHDLGATNAQSPVVALYQT